MWTGIIGAIGAGLKALASWIGLQREKATNERRLGRAEQAEADRRAADEAQRKMDSVTDAGPDDLAQRLRNGEGFGQSDGR